MVQHRGASQRFATSTLCLAALLALTSGCSRTPATAPETDPVVETPSEYTNTTANLSQSVPLSTTTALPSTTTTTEPPASLIAAEVEAAESLGPMPDGTRLAAARRAAALYGNGCHLHWGATRPRPCVFGAEDSETVIVITGDSHAAHWFGAFEEAALAEGWKLVTVTKAGCPAADVPVYSMQEGLQDKGIRYEACAAWRPLAQEYIRSLRPDLVVFPMLTRRGVIGSPGRSALKAWSAGLGRSIDAVRADDTGILILGDTPKTNGQDAPSCVNANKDDIRACGNDRRAAVFIDRLAMLQETAERHQASYVDVSDWICGERRCPAVVSGHVVYRDSHHLSDGFSRHLAPVIRAAVRDALVSD